MNYKIILLFLVVVILSLGCVSAADDNGLDDVIDDQQNIDIVVDEDVNNIPIGDVVELDSSNSPDVNEVNIIYNPSSIIIGNSSGNGSGNGTSNDTNVTPVHPVRPVNPHNWITPTKHIKNYYTFGDMKSQNPDDQDKNLTDNSTRQNHISPSENNDQKNYHTSLKEIEASVPIIIFILIVLIMLVTYRTKK